MSVYLGNLSIEQMEKRVGVDFPQELKDYMKLRRQHSADVIQQGMWHCFDIPFVLVCGDMDTATEIHSHLESLSSDFEESLKIALDDLSEGGEQ